MYVKCIDNENAKSYLTKDKIYNVIKKGESLYLIKDDKDDTNAYSVERFIPVEEDNKMKVKCIDNKNNTDYLTINKIYTVIEEYKTSYKIVDDENKMFCYSKYRFVKVPEVNEVNESEIVTIAKEIGQLVEKKDKDYNSAFSKTLKEYGNVAYFIRIDDKLNRLKNLMLNNTKAEVDESVEDTLKDIIGYTLLMLKEIKDKTKKGITF